MSVEGKKFEHPSYGMVGFSRVTGNPGRLFGSSVSGSSVSDHGTFVSLRITRASRQHDLSRDWYHGDMTPIIEVYLSSAQFAELLTSMNIGSGVPCTIRYTDGQSVESPPNELLEAEQVKHDFKGRIDELAVKLISSQKHISELLEKKALTQADRKEVNSLLDGVVREIKANMPFVLESFEKATKQMETAAKAEVDAFMTHAMMVAGMNALQAGDARTARTLPEGAEGD